MIDLTTMNGAQAAIVRECLDQSDVGYLAGVETLWLTPETDKFILTHAIRVPRLRTLYVAECHQPLLEMVERESLLNITTLVVAGAPAVLTGILELGCLAELKTLKIRRQELRTELIEWVSEQHSLVSLALTDTNACDEVVASLSCSGHLRQLDLFRSDVSLCSAKLSGCLFSMVRSLDVSETKVSGDSIKTLRTLFPHIERLVAQCTRLRDIDLRQIAEWEGLVILDTNTPEVDFDRHGDDFWEV